MELTKYAHACLILSKDGKRLIIDPGSFATLPEDLSHIAVVVITEEHMDHYNLDNLKAILAQSPTAKIFTTQAVSEKLTSESIPSTAVSGDRTFAEAGFSLSFYETDHAPIYQTSPCKSLPMQVDDYLYYPSDTY